MLLPLDSVAKEAPSVCINVAEMLDNASDTNQDRIKLVGKSGQSFNVSTVIVTLRLAKVRLLAYIGGMDFQTEFSNLNGSYLNTVNCWQNRPECRKCKLFFCYFFFASLSIDLFSIFSASSF